jgi:hypothetical protein
MNVEDRLDHIDISLSVTAIMPGISLVDSGPAHGGNAHG